MIRSMILIPMNGATMPPRPYASGFQRSNADVRPWTILHAAQSQRHQRDDDQRVKDNGRKNCRFRSFQLHDVQRLKDREGSS